MENKTEKRKKLFEVLVITLFLTYGIHYFGYFLRRRYYNLIEPLMSAEPGLYSILSYLGHVIFWIVFAIYVFSVKGERKYFEALLPGRGNNRLSKLFVGMLLGCGMNALCILGAALHGDISITAAKGLNVGLFILAFFAVLIQASQEEMESRLFFFGKLREGEFSLAAAAALSSLYFSYLHAANPGFGILPFISITLCGVFAVLLYCYYGSIWAACGWHQLWNFTQDFIFGLPNSGNPSGMSIFKATANGSSFFYDADFGVEGSLMCIILQLAGSLLLVLLLRKKPRADSVSGVLCDPEPSAE